jgi:hypothetical protein
MIDKHLSNRQANTLVAFIYIFSGIYCTFFIFSVYNIVCLISKQRRYAQPLISTFYFLSITVMVTRVCDMVGLSWMYKKVDEEEH